ncbi:hypothetical protein J4T85_019895 [Sinorhizobium medicae]|uniref:hypothetical protein n=1 Tax=Sinorhizobium medicae TaxID=110321 RepID=UPI001AAF85D2|nr:hypothetical protein [Sinorhizobium medicae]MBO1963800.1 hypothetical protein [Sinorhizobium medicae]
MIEDDELNFANRAVEYVLAKARMEGVAAYVGRGRNFSGLGNDALMAEWIESFKRWVRDMTPESRQVQNDLSAEIELRNLEPPLDQVTEEWNILKERAQRAAEKPDAADKIGGSIIADYVDAKTREN